MAQIKIHGTPKKVDKKEIKEAASFFCDYLMKRLSKNVLVVIKLKKDLYKQSKCFGFAMYTDDDAKNHNHREFEIEVDSGLGRVFLLRTIAHELTHVKQYARKELVDGDCNYQKWNKVLYNEKVVGYKNLPWEAEARLLEKQLYEMWKEKSGR